MAKKTALAFPDDEDDHLWRQIVQWVADSGSPQGDALPTSTNEGLPYFRPSLRPPVPIITVLDDGSLEQGESVRMRQETLTIGRTSGDIQIPNDLAMSGSHAEIRKASGGLKWHLHDLDSINGTFVRCSQALLDEKAIVILGSRRFRLRSPQDTDAAPQPLLSEPKCVPPIGRYTALVETSAFNPEALEFPLRSEVLDIGYTGGGAAIEIDDPLLEDRHAILRRRREGIWEITSSESRNGVWVSIGRAVALSPKCFFRCGEQLFRFVVP